tara:strand:+ start:227 stop:886 length:660 start_codon:yes stop_codon:yes gene_type:complete
MDLGEFNWKRIRERNLVKFLVDHYGGMPRMLLTEVVERMVTLQEVVSKGVEYPLDILTLKQINKDLSQIIERKGAQVTVSDAAQRTVILITGNGRVGKSSLTQGLKSSQISVCVLDSFSRMLGTSWCPDDCIRTWSNEFGDRRVAEFWRKVVAENKSEVVMDLFFATETYTGKGRRGGIFTPCGPLSIIEGSLPRALRKLLIKQLKKRGYRVWVLQRSE